MKRISVLVAVMMPFFLFSCTRQPPVAAASSEAANPQSPRSAGQDPESDEMTIAGILSPTVERGGWILETEQGEFLLLRASRFYEEAWFKEGNRLKARGRIARDVVTTFMQGTPFMVSELEPSPDSGGNEGGLR